VLIFKLNFFFFRHLVCPVLGPRSSVSVSVSSALFLVAKYTFYLASDCSIRFLFLYALCVGLADTIGDLPLEGRMEDEDSHIYDWIIRKCYRSHAEVALS